ncbi:MAG: glycosyltransferase [Caldilineaceae bacterium]
MSEHFPVEQPRRLQVLFIAAWYPVHNNPGRGIFVREHAKAVGLYNDVTVLHSRAARRDLAGAWDFAEETDPALTEGIPTYVADYRLGIAPRIARVMRHWSVIQAYQRIVATGFRPDILHAHVHEVALPTVILGKRYRIPVVITEHHSAFPRKMLRAVDLWEARVAFPLAQCVMPVSEALQRGIAARGVRGNFEIVPNVVDTTVFTPNAQCRPSAPPIRLLFVGNMPPTHVKGIPHLVDALEKLHAKRADWHLDLIGEGPMRAAYEAQVAAAGLQQQITFHGRKTKREVVAAMQTADLFVLSSTWDNMPCVIIEAMACGLPIVATNVGGIPEMVDRHSGLLAAPGDSDSLHDALFYMLDHLHDFDATAIAKQARRRYSMEAIGQQFDKIYRSVL